MFLSNDVKIPKIARMKQFFRIFFAVLILVVSLSGNLHVLEKDIKKSPLFQFVMMNDFLSPIIHLKIPKNQQIWNHLFFTKHKNHLNLNGLNFELIHLSIHNSFISLDLVSLNKSSIVELMKECASKNINKRTLFESFDWIVSASNESITAVNFKTTKNKFILETKILKGFVGLSLQPPRV